MEHPLDRIRQGKRLENQHLKSIDDESVKNNRWLQLRVFTSLLCTDAPTGYPTASQLQAALRGCLTLSNDEDEATRTAILQAELLGKVRTLLGAKRTPQALAELTLVARLWSVLSPVGGPVDEFQRWLPADGRGERDAGEAEAAAAWFAVSGGIPQEERAALRRVIALVEAVDRHTEVRYPLLFPVVAFNPPRKDAPREAIGQALVRVRVALVKKEFYPEGTNVLLAPWTRLLPDLGEDKGFIALQGAAGALPWLKEHAILLDFQPLEADEGPPELLPRWRFEGGSLGLAVVLSLWAAFRRRELKPVVATGVLFNNSIHNVDEDTILRKVETVRIYKGWLRHERPAALSPDFLLPEDNARQLPPAQQNELGVRAVPARPLPELEDFWDKQVSIGFAPYLQAVREVGRRAAPGPSSAGEMVVTSDFNDDPEPLAFQRLLRLGTGDEPSGRVPLLVRCDRLPEGFIEFKEVLEQALRVGWRRFRELSGLADVRVDDDELRNAVRYFPERFALVVYGAPSLELPAYEPVLKEALTRLRTFAQADPSNDHRPQVCFIASDLHHDEFIREQWGLPRRFGPKATTTRS